MTHDEQMLVAEFYAKIARRLENLRGRLGAALEPSPADAGLLFSAAMLRENADRKDIGRHAPALAKAFVSIAEGIELAVKFPGTRSEQMASAIAFIEGIETGLVDGIRNQGFGHVWENCSIE